MIHALVLAYLASGDVRPCAPKTVSYVSSWGGLGTPRSSRGTLDTAGPKVARLVRAMFADPVDRPSTVQLGLTPDVLAPFVPKVASWMFGRLGDLPTVRQRAQALYLDPTLRAAFVARVVPPPGVERITTDTYPHEEVDVTCEDGRIARAQSEQNSSTFMLPWTVAVGATTFQTYNAEIPRAMFAMLGKLDVNPYYISDEGMAQAYVSDLQSEYARRYGEPDALQVAPAFEARLAALGYTPSLAFLDRGPEGRVDFQLHPIDFPEASFAVSIGAGDGAADADAVDSMIASRMASLRASSWFWNALHRPDVRVRFLPAVGEFGKQDSVSTLRRHSRTAAADFLATAEGATAIDVGVCGAKPMSLNILGGGSI